MTRSRGIRAPRVIWTEEQIEQMRLRYPHEKTEKIAADIGMTLRRVYRKARSLGLEKTSEYMASPDACRLRRDNPQGVRHRFPKGHVPANKGLRRPGYSPGKMAETQFKKGQKPHTWMPLGSERYSKEGYLQRKISDTGYPPRDWKAVHILLWEQHNGPVPQGHAVAFKDGDKKRIAIENLELVSRADMMKRNTYHNYPKEIAQLIQLRGAVQRQINKRSKQNERADKSTDK